LTARSGAGLLPMLTAGAVMLLLLTAGGLRYDHFASPSNLSNLVNDYASIFIAAAGATLVILLGGIDLSVGSLAALSGVTAGALIEHGCHPFAAAAVCVALGCAAGSAMGALIQAFQIPAFMVTLAGMFVFRALAFLVSGQSTGVTHPFLRWAARSGGIELPAGAHVSISAILAAAVMLALFALARLTPFGRNIYAIGGAERSARAMGVPVARTRIAVYAIAGGCSALAGFTFTLDRLSADPSSAAGLELTVIAAVVIGGTLLSGGVGSVAGTVVGVLILGLIRMIIDFQGNLNSAWTSIATGILLLAFVGLQRAIASVSLRAGSHPDRERRPPCPRRSSCASPR
jgi:galactofuranose transport system permease protein